MLKHPVGLNCFVFKPEIWEIWSLFFTVLPLPLCFILLGDVSEQAYWDFNALKSKVSLNSEVHTATQGASLFCVFPLSPCWTGRIIGLQNSSVEVQSTNSRVISCRDSKEESGKGNTKASLRMTT